MLSRKTALKVLQSSFAYPPEFKLSQLYRGRPRMQGGLTLIELLACLCIIAILANSAMPSFRYFYQSVKAQIVANEIVKLVNFARTTAMNKSSMVTLCPSQDKQYCSGRNWAKSILVFVDYDHNGLRSEEEPLLWVSTAAPEGSRLSWRSFRNKPYLQMTPNGTTNYQNGRFVYCAPIQNEKLHRQVVVHKTGRPRIVPRKALKPFCQP